MNEEQLLDTFGELLYALVSTGSGVSTKTKGAVSKELSKYDWGEKAFWSFNYESSHNRSAKEAYERALDTFTENGPSDKYYLFIDIMEKIADLYATTDYQKRIPLKFKEELMERLKSNAETAETSDDELDD